MTWLMKEEGSCLINLDGRQQVAEDLQIRGS